MPCSSAIYVIGASTLAVPVAFAQCPGERVHSPLRWHHASFGLSVQVAGDVAVVGDSSDHTFCGATACFNGAVHVFRHIDGIWEFEDTIFHSRVSPAGGPIGDLFGNAVAIDGPDRFAASAPGEDVVEPDTGAVYIFERDGEAWREVAEILPVEPVWASGFGGRLVLRGDTLVISQFKYNVAYIYRERNGRWEFAQRIEPPDPRLRARFGMAMALDGEWLAMGAPGHDALAPFAGRAYLFRRQPGGDFEFVQKLEAPRPEESPEFGWAVALHNGTLAVGAVSADGEWESQGAVYIYDLNGGEWRYAAELQHDDPVRADALGISVAVHGDLVVAGAPRQQLPTSYGAGYVFQRRADGSWRQAARLLPALARPGDFSFDFGKAIATDGATVIVGAPGETVGGAPNTGAAHLYDLACLLCRADLDGDGELTLFDFLAFQNLFAAGDMTADFDGDGELTFFDFLAFQNEYAAGCD